MLNVKEKKIAIVGTSPIMLIFAKVLSKKNSVTIFEKKKIGGAWIYGKVMNLNTNLFTNVIVPTNKINEKKTIKLNNFLKNFNVKVKSNKKSYRSVSPFRPRPIYQYDFSSFYPQILKEKKINIKKINIKYVNERKQYVLINKKLKFDMIFIPLYNSLRFIQYLNKKIFIPFKKIISKHIIFVTKKPIIKDLYYCEQGHEFFDRMQIKKNKKLYIFTARIAKKFKSKNKLFFIKNFSFLDSNEVYYSKINSYINYYRNKKQIENLKSINSKKIKIVNTAQLFISISTYFLKD